MDKIIKYEKMLDAYKIQVENRYGECCGFAYDGPINPEDWFYSEREPKILFLLKEAYGYYGNDICEIMNRPERFNDSRTNLTISKLVYALQKASASIKEANVAFTSDTVLFQLLDPIYDEMPSVSNDRLKDSFSSIAIVEVKKVSGESTSDDANIRMHSREFAALLTEQVKFLNPDIIFCGGQVTWDSLTEDMNVFDRALFHYKGKGAYKVGGTIIYNSYHPSYPGFNSYDCLFDLCKDS